MIIKCAVESTRKSQWEDLELRFIFLGQTSHVVWCRINEQHDNNRFLIILLLPLTLCCQKCCHPISQLVSWHMGSVLWLHSLGLSQGGSPQAHDESTVMESASTLDAVLRLRVRDLHLCVALHVMDHIAIHQMGVQTLHWTWGQTHATGYSFNTQSVFTQSAAVCILSGFYLAIF